MVSIEIVTERNNFFDFGQHFNFGIFSKNRESCLDCPAAIFMLAIFQYFASELSKNLILLDFGGLLHDDLDNIVSILIKDQGF